ncbi:hypothetical protein DdX_18393 [Ditylenchus destructor]|uniref:C2H2-type domain-containing protein n=1 Tax=Ditylenchus destructor TaxID=166010 RepID=A0AAD4MPL6_9BILA|nr:hypothetical protein DdX_18393 [Ditylenchus destructor]
MNQLSSSVIFQCDECFPVIKDESAFWNHLSTLHLEYFPYRYGYLLKTGEIHSTRTEDKMKHHLETIQRYGLQAMAKTMHIGHFQYTCAFGRSVWKKSKRLTDMFGKTHFIVMVLWRGTDTRSLHYEGTWIDTTSLQLALCTFYPPGDKRITYNSRCGTLKCAFEGAHSTQAQSISLNTGSIHLTQHRLNLSQAHSILNPDNFQIFISSERPVICERYFFTANLKVQFYAFILELCFNCKSSNFAKKPHKTEYGYRIEYRLCSACASRNAHSDRSYVKDIQNDEKKDFYLDWKMNENLLWMLKAYHRTMPFYTYQTIMCGTCKNRHIYMVVNITGLNSMCDTVTLFGGYGIISPGRIEFLAPDASLLARWLKVAITP